MSNDSGHTLGQDEMAAILDSGYDDPAPTHGLSQNPFAPSPLQRSHYAPAPMSSTDSTPVRHAPTALNGSYEIGQYIPIDRPALPASPGIMPNSGDSVSSSIERNLGNGHAKKRSGGAGQDRYGPMGPLADDGTGWGERYERGGGGGGGGDGRAKGKRI